MKITRELLEVLRPEVNNALKQIGEKYGLSLTIGIISHSELEADMHLLVTAEKNKDFDPAQETWNRSIMFTGLTPEDYGKEILIGKDIFVIAGYNPKAKKNHVVIRSAAGKEYVTDIPSVLKALGRGDSKMEEREDVMAKVTFKGDAMTIGFSNLEYGTVISYCGEEYQLVKVNLRAPKYPFVAIRTRTGERVKLPRDLVANALNQK